MRTWILCMAHQYPCAIYCVEVFRTYTKAHVLSLFVRLHEMWKIWANIMVEDLTDFEVQLWVRLSCSCHFADTFAMCTYQKQHLTMSWYKCTGRGDICGTWTCYPSTGHVAPGLHKWCDTVNASASWHLRMHSIFRSSSAGLRALSLFCCTFCHPRWVRSQVSNVCFDWCGTECNAGSQLL